MTQLVLVEGLPGAGKTTTARLVEEWFRARSSQVQHFGEGRNDHPVDFEQASVLAPADLRELCRAFPAEADSLVAAAARRDDVWIVPDRERPTWSDGLRSRLRAKDVYDGDVGPTLEPLLTAAAAERPAAWLDFVVRYHTEQGYGRARPGRLRRAGRVHAGGP